MLRTGFRMTLFALVVCGYVAAVSVAILGLVDLRESRCGAMDVARHVVEKAKGDGAQSLLLTGEGFGRDTRALLVAETQIDEQPQFLDGRLSRGLWSDGRTLLTSYDGNLLLNLRVESDGGFQILGSTRLPGRISQVVKVGERALVSLMNGGFWLVDLSDPARLELVEELESDGTETLLVKDMLTYGERVYAPAKDGRLTIFDMSLRKPLVKSLPIGGQPWRAAIHQDRLVIGSLEGELQLFELDAAGMPRPVGHMAFEKDIRGIGLDASGLYVILGNGELHIFDPRTWPRPEVRSVLPLQGQFLGLCIVPGRSQILLSKSAFGLLAVDVSDPLAPVAGNGFSRVPTVREFVFADDRIFAASRQALAAFPIDQVVVGAAVERLSLQSFDYGIHDWGEKAYLLSIGNDDQDGWDEGDMYRTLWPLPGQLGQERQGLPAVRSPEPENCLAVSESSDSFVHLFCRNPADGLPHREATLFRPNQMAAFWKYGRIYIIERNETALAEERGGTLQIFDAADPRHPVAVGALSLPGWPVDLAWLDPHFVLVAGGPEGLYIVDVANPARPELAAHLPVPDHLRRISQVNSVLVAGNRAYLTHQRNGISKVNLTDPRQPVIERMLNTPGYAKQMHLQGNLLLVSMYQKGIFLVDVKDGGLAAAGIIETPFSVFDLSAGQDRIFVSGAAGGLVEIARPRQLPVLPQGSLQARIPLPKDLAPERYRLYLYNETGNLQVKFALPADAEKNRAMAQNE